MTKNTELPLLLLLLLRRLILAKLSAFYVSVSTVWQDNAMPTKESV